ncbi:hypothetical protein HK101_000414 [Irineochytrium annulatum]|nr:hypothetical protein HK101_000414 [Irineochytrium annulatum]
MPNNPPYTDLDLDLLMSLGQDPMYDQNYQPVMPSCHHPLFAPTTAFDPTAPLDDDALAALLSDLNSSSCASIPTSPAFSLASFTSESPSFHYPSPFPTSPYLPSYPSPPPSHAPSHTPNASAPATAMITPPTPPPQQQPNANTLAVPRTKDWACGTCQMRFFRKHDMLRHERAHVRAVACPNGGDARQHTCAGCGRSYARSDGLRRHLRCEDTCFVAMCEAGKGGRRGKRLLASRRASEFGGAERKAQESSVESEISRASVALMESLMTMGMK